MTSLNFEIKSKPFQVPCLSLSILLEENPSTQKAEVEEEAVRNKTGPNSARREEEL